jgi:phosphoglycolate phosphatase
MNVFFDLDGTLTDSRPGILASMRHSLRAIGVESPPDEQLVRLIGPPTRDAFRALLGSADVQLVERAIVHYRERFASVGMFENSVYPGVREGLLALASVGVRMWVVTSKPGVYADKIIDHFDLRAPFARVYGSHLNGDLATKADLIAHALSTEGLKRDETWMVGDRMHDIIGAHENGLRAAGVLWGYGTREELTEAEADRLFASMGELVAAFVIPSV